LKTVAALVLAVGLASCRAQRELIITTEPPGAEIRLDGILLNEKTPARIPFKDYGVRRVTLYLEDHLSYSEAVDLRPPWYGYFPLDFISEILIPIGWHDRHKLNVQLTPGDARIEAPDLLGVMQRAEDLRRAGPDGPSRAHAQRARTLPRETTGATPAETPSAPQPPPPPVSGGGGR
jgi:hypothetical protein